MTINGTEVLAFSKVTITRALNGFGQSGCVTSQLTFDMPYAVYMPYAQRAEVVFSGQYLSIPKFYINTRKKHGSTVSFVCYDCMAFAEQVCSLSENAFDSDDLIQTQTVLSTICSQCGLGTAENQGSLTVYAPYLDKADVYGKSCRSILEMLSVIVCGEWYITAENNLRFLPFASAGGIISEQNIVSQANSDSGFARDAYKCVKVTGGETTYIGGDQTADALHTLSISTNYAVQAMATDLFDRLKSFNYQPFSCAKMQLKAPVDIGMQITTLDGGSYYINSVKLTPSAAGLFAEVACNDVSESEFTYFGYLQRQITDSIKDSERLSGTLITRYQGVLHTADTTNSSGQKVTKKYGYKTDSSGITEYAGALVSKVVPATATVNSDKTEVTIGYRGGKRYKYTVTKDADGNITGMTKTEVVS